MSNILLLMSQQFQINSSNMFLHYTVMI